MEQQLLEAEDVTDTSQKESVESSLGNVFDNLKIISDVIKVKVEQKDKLVNSKQERIYELENVLKASVRIASERENEYHQLIQINEDTRMKVRVQMNPFIPVYQLSNLKF